MKRQAEREERKNDEYKAALDEFNRFARGIKFKLTLKAVAEELIREFDELHSELSEEISDRIEMYRENDTPLDDCFKDYLSYMKLEVRRQGKVLDCTERLGVMV